MWLSMWRVWLNAFFISTDPNGAKGRQELAITQYPRLDVKKVSYDSFVKSLYVVLGPPGSVKSPTGPAGGRWGSWVGIVLLFSAASGHGDRGSTTCSRRHYLVRNQATGCRRYAGPTSHGRLCPPSRRPHLSVYRPCLSVLFANGTHRASPTLSTL